VADQSLGELTVGWLTRFLRDQQQRYPQQFVSTLEVEELAVRKKLTVVDQAEFSSMLNAKVIGTAGQPAFTNGWVSYGAPYSNASYIKRPGGWVELIGVIKNGTVGSAAFTLPPGFRPISSKPLATMSNGVFGRVDIGSDGTVTPISPSNNASVVLDDLHFKIA
jgi:hypothetical protein